MRYPAKFFRLVLRSVAGAALLAVASHAAELEIKNLAILTPEQKSALTALDRVVKSYEDLVQKDPDAKHKADAEAVLAGLKERAAAIQETFDQGKYEELRVDVNLEYQRLASWEKPPVTPATARVEPIVATVAHLNPDPANKADVQTALATLEKLFRRVDAQVEAVPVGPERDAARQRLAVSRQHGEVLAKKFTKPAWNALVAELKAQSEKLPF